MSARLTEIIDRRGFVHARIAWDGDNLVELRVAGAIVRGEIVDDPLLGRAHPIATLAGEVRTTMSAIDWARPTEIPAIAAPGAIPPGAGGAIMNVLAILAQRTGVTELRYAGPYPTHALFSTLARSFRTTTSVDAFTSEFADRAARVARDPMPAVFMPAPHERVAIVRSTDQPVRGVVELRDGLERATVDGVVYARGHGVARLVDHRLDESSPDRVRAEVWFADELHAHIATFARDGELLEGPSPVPACESDVLGKAFPPEMIAALAELIAELVPGPLARDAPQVLLSHPLRWADLGARAAAIVGSELHVHAALWRLAQRGLARVAMAIVEALVPVVTPLAAATLASRRFE